MAFADGTFTRLSGSNSTGGSVFLYTETETLLNVRAANYFNDAFEYGLRGGDVIMLICSDGFGMSSMAFSDPNFTVVESITSA
jgi:hypothetical protein